VGPGRQRQQKKRKRESERRAGAGGLDGPTGLAGPKGEQGMVSFFLFFFKLLFFKPHFFSNSNQTLSNFFSKIYKLFRNHTSNQKPCKPTDDAQTLVVSKFIKLCLIF
jgi:hypothetical protein